MSEGKLTGQIGEKCVDPIVKLSVGDEFIEWAERYWGLRDKFTVKENSEGESCPYRVIKEIFASKINDIVKERLFCFDENDVIKKSKD